jgi:hypothetical protein
VLKGTSESCKCEVTGSSSGMLTFSNVRRLYAEQTNLSKVRGDNLCRCCPIIWQANGRCLNLCTFRTSSYVLSYKKM